MSNSFNIQPDLTPIITPLAVVDGIVDILLDDQFPQFKSVNVTNNTETYADLLNITGKGTLVWVCVGTGDVGHKCYLRMNIDGVAYTIMDTNLIYTSAEFVQVLNDAAGVATRFELTGTVIMLNINFKINCRLEIRTETAGNVSYGMCGYNEA